MSSTVDLSFRYTEGDYVRAFRAHHASRLRLRVDIGLAVALTVIGIYLWKLPSFRWLGVVCVVISAVFGLMLFAVFTIIPRVVFRRERKFGDAYSLAFSPDGIHFRTSSVDSGVS